jgi:hypothetical protein
MILRVDRLQVELPAPSDPDPAAAAHVQELLGGRFGEMSTLMNYTYQSFNFRGRQKAKPFYDLIANIATEEYGHIELVSAVINGLLTGASEGEDVTDSPLRRNKDGAGLRHHWINSGFGALPVNSLGQGWNGEYVFNSGDLVLDLLHNFFLENGARTPTSRRRASSPTRGCTASSTASRRPTSRASARCGRARTRSTGRRSRSSTACRPRPPRSRPTCPRSRPCRRPACTRARSPRSFSG